MTDLVIRTLADRPDLADQAYAFENPWPAFMRQDRVADVLYPRLMETFPQHCVVATIDAEPVARGFSIPFALHTDERGGVLPDSGWEQMLIWGFEDHASGAQADTVSALEVAITVSQLGRGLSHAMLAALRGAASDAGFGELVAPVRPSAKHRQPELPMTDYITQVDDAGLPADPWLRVHVRAGATIEKVAPTSMVVPGTLAEWREWTGLPFDRTGPVIVPQALSPVHCDVDNDHAVYVEPNVWVRHRL